MLLMDMGIIEAKRRAAELTPNAKFRPGLEAQPEGIAPRTQGYADSTGGYDGIQTD